MQRKRLVIIGSIFALTLVIIFAILSSWLFELDRQISVRLEGRRFSAPVEYYTGPLRVFSGQKLSKANLRDSLKRLRYIERKSEGALHNGDYVFLNPEACQANLNEDLAKDTEACLLIAKRAAEKPAEGVPEKRDIALISFGAEDTVFGVYSGEPLAHQEFIQLEPVLFAQFFGADPIMRDVVTLGDVPPICLNAVIAIEDSDFLEHRGISTTGILRAILKNVTRRKAMQGGSTITQQLVKNYFLTPEKTLKRKVTEIAMAVLLESHATKDDILETYINEIYMGQNGPFQIRGYGAASGFYFGKDIADLNLPECALIAALVNSPGLYSPFTKGENATKRRALVLSRMEELKLISPTERLAAEAIPLPKVAQRVLSEPAPYFVDAARREVDRLGIDQSNGLRIYTTLDLRAQEAAQQAVKNGIERLEAENKTIKKIRTEQNKLLEGALVSADPRTGEIQALVGGRSFRVSQFNRVIQSNRQVGSIFKPIVYLTALQRGISGDNPNPLTLIDDITFTVKYDKQEWTPKNYEKTTYGSVPMYFALRNSLNVATSALALKVGLPEIIEVAHDLGIKSDLRPVPALALGAFEMTPIEVLQVYQTFAKFGERVPLSLIRRIESVDGEVLFENRADPIRVANEQDTGVLVSMMKQTLINGTAWFVSKLGFTHPAAGKTGTTSDTKDAWFSGFTPFHLAVVWIGYDDNTEMGLTGASGAVPIWADYMKRAAASYPPQDFAWPGDLTRAEISIDRQIDMNIPEEKGRPLAPIELVFRSGSEPR